MGHLQQLHPHLPQPQPPQVPPPQPQNFVMQRVESYVRTLSTTLPGHAAARTPVSASPTRAPYARELTWPWLSPASALLKEALVPVLVLIYAWTMCTTRQHLYPACQWFVLPEGHLILHRVLLHWQHLHSSPIRPYQ